jgi:hypothetical protein
MARKRNRRRRRNPAPLLTAVIAGGAAVAGLAIGWALSRTGEEAPGAEWNYWVAARHTTVGIATGVEYVPHIRSPKGEEFELPAEITEFGAENAAEREIERRGGVPVLGKPVG